jgi:hypothetical protein
MLEPLRRSLGMRIAKFRFRKLHERVQSFTHLLPSAGTALVIMPLSAEEAGDHTNVLSLFRKHFPPENLTVLTPALREKIERLLPRSRVITIAPDETSFLYIPRQVVLDRVHARQYDIAVDLNLDFMLPSAYICRESNARVRVGRSGPHADTFFNFQVRLDPSSQKGDAYGRLVQCLQMFFAGEGV